mgnify:CR=1 FL=1|jgi:hypothetical protein
MAAGLRDRAMLDPERCWKLWHVELGTLNAVRRQLESEGLINPKTGNPPTNSGIEKAAFSWALENPTEARQDLARAWLEEGVVLKDEDWKKVITNMAKLVFHQRPRKFERYIEKHQLERYI